MKVTRTGRPYCVIRDPAGDGPSLQVNPVLYDVLRRVLDNRLTCTVDLNFVDGGLGNSHVRMDGEKWSKAPEKIDAAATLQVR